MAPKARFARGLRDEFVADLVDGHLTPILSAAREHELDLQIRENYIDIYHAGRRVLKLRHLPRLSQHRAIIHP